MQTIRGGVYEVYYEFNLRVDRIRPHQVLAINRGEAQKVLRVSIDVSERDRRPSTSKRIMPFWLSTAASVF